MKLTREAPEMVGRPKRLRGMRRPGVGLGRTFLLSLAAMGLGCLVVGTGSRPAVVRAMSGWQVQENGGLPGPVHSPSGLPPLSPLINRHPDANRVMEDAMKTQEAEKRLKALNVQRQKQMTTDAAKLVVLAQELEKETNGGGGPSMSAVDLRKAEQIEKLARGVREKMTATMGPN